MTLETLSSPFMILGFSIKCCGTLLLVSLGASLDFQFFIPNFIGVFVDYGCVFQTQLL